MLLLICKLFGRLPRRDASDGDETLARRLKRARLEALLREIAEPARR